MPLLDGFRLRHKARRVIATALGRTSATGCCAAIVLRDPKRHGGRPALKISARRRGDDHVDIFGRRLHAEEHFARDHEGPQINRPALHIGKPRAVNVCKQAAGFDEQFLRQFRHRHPPCRRVKALRIGIRAEQSHGAIFEAIGLQPFEDFLRIMEHSCRRIERQRLTRRHLCIIPALAFRIADSDHMIGKDFAEAGGRDACKPFRLRDR